MDTSSCRNAEEPGPREIAEALPPAEDVPVWKWDRTEWGADRLYELVGDTRRVVLIDESGGVLDEDQVLIAFAPALFALLKEVADPDEHSVPVSLGNVLLERGRPLHDRILAKLAEIEKERGI